MNCEGCHKRITKLPFYEFRGKAWHEQHYDVQPSKGTKPRVRSARTVTTGRTRKGGQEAPRGKQRFSELDGRPLP